jgi:hypothetical protein
LVEFFLQPSERLFPGDVAPPASLHGTNDGRRAKAAGEINNRADEVAGTDADVGIGIGEGELAANPAGAGAHRRELEVVLSEQTAQGHAVEIIGVRWEDFHGVETVFLGLGEAGCESVVEDERTRARLRHEANGNGGADHFPIRALHGGDGGALPNRRQRISKIPSKFSGQITV